MFLAHKYIVISKMHITYFFAINNIKDINIIMFEGTFCRVEVQMFCDKNDDATEKSCYFLRL